MKYKWLLFDLDNTILDFSSASKVSLFQSLEQCGIMCDEKMYKDYKVENGKVWHSFEQKEIDTDELRKIRFKSFFEMYAIKEDPFEFNKLYLENIVKNSDIYPGAKALLQQLKKEYKLSIVTNGLKEVQRPRMRKTEIYDLFDSIVVSDEIGVAKPDGQFFEIANASLDIDFQKSEMLMIGDSLKSDILGGNNYGVDTCWLSHGKKNESEILSTHTINTVHDLPEVL